MKNKVGKKFGAAFLASVMIMGMTACGSEESGQNVTENVAASTQEGQTADAETTASVQDEVEKPAQITWWTHDGLNEDNGAEQWFAEYERLTGIHLEHQFIANNEYYDKLKLACASGEVPEVFDLDGTNLPLYASQGVLYDLTDMVKSSELYEKVDPEIWESVSIDGKIYAIPRDMPGATVTYVRGDWLQRLGMDAPTNYDEFIEMLRRFKAEIPECDIALTAPGVKSEMYLPEFYQGAHYGFAKVDGEWIDGFAQDNMAAAMQRMQDAYKEGLLDMEIITNATSTCRDEWYSGNVGVFNYWSGGWGETLQNRLSTNVPDAVTEAIEPIDGAQYLYTTLQGHCISSSVSAEKASQIFKYFIEYMHDGGEGQVLFQSGVEGVHWEQDGNNIKPLPRLSNPAEVTTSVWMGPTNPIRPLEVTDKNFVTSEEAQKSSAIAEANAKQTPIMPVSATLNKITADLELEKSDILAKVVMGEMTVEQGVAAYKEVAEELNVDKVLEELNGK